MLESAQERCCRPHSSAITTADEDRQVEGHTEGKSLLQSKGMPVGLPDHPRRLRISS
jgi:hypothetical protein